MSRRKYAVIFVLFGVFVVIGVIVNFVLDWNEWTKRLSLSGLLFVLVLIYYLMKRNSGEEK